MIKKVYLATVLVETNADNSAYAEIIGTEENTDLECMESWCKEEVDAVAGEYTGYDETGFEGTPINGGYGYRAKYRSTPINITIDIDPKEIEI